MSGPSACQPRCENLSGEDSSRLVLKLREVDGSWGFYHKTGTKNWLWRKKLTSQPGDKTAVFFLQQTSRNHPVEHQALSSHRDVEHTPPRCLPLASKDIFLISLACHHFSRDWVGSLEVWKLRFGGWWLVIFCRIPWGGRSEGRGG